jgi:hypothetical protein
LSGVPGGTVTVYLQTADSSGRLSTFASATASPTLAGRFVIN